MEEHHAAILGIFLLIGILIGVSIITHKAPPVKDVTSKVKHYLLPDGTRLHAPPPHLDRSKMNKSTTVAPVDTTSDKERGAKTQPEMKTITEAPTQKETQQILTEEVTTTKSLQVKATMETATKSTMQTKPIKEVKTEMQTETKKTNEVTTGLGLIQTEATKEEVPSRKSQAKSTKGTTTLRTTQKISAKELTTPLMSKAKLTKEKATSRTTQTISMKKERPTETISTKAVTPKPLQTKPTKQATLTKAEKVGNKVSTPTTLATPISDYHEFVNKLRATKSNGKYPICEDVYSDKIPWTSEQQKRQSIFNKEIQKRRMQSPEQQFALFPGT